MAEPSIHIQGSETSETDDEFRAYDLELNRLLSQRRGPITPSKPKPTPPDLTYPPTPAPTPSSSQNQPTNPTTAPKTPITLRFPPTQNAHLTPATTPAQLRKRSYVAESSTDDDDDDAITTTPSKKRTRAQEDNDDTSPSSNTRARLTAASFRMPPTVALPLQSSPAKAIGASFRLPPALNHTPQASSSPTVSAPETPPPRRTDISAFEIKRVVAAVMEQVDWAELAADVACNRRAGVYRRAVREVLGQWLEEAVEAKEEVGKEKQKGKG